MKYTDYDSFAEKVGILSEEELIALGWECDNGNRICTSKLAELKIFVKKLNSQAIQFITGDSYVKYHIATDLQSGGVEDTAIEKFCKKNKIKADEDGNYPEGINAWGVSIVNRVAYCDRLDYFLCNGDANEDLFLEEVFEVRDDREVA